MTAQHIPQLRTRRRLTRAAALSVLSGLTLYLVIAAAGVLNLVAATIWLPGLAAAACLVILGITLARRIP